MPAASNQGLSDEQVEELLQALLDFRQLLLGLTDRYQTRLALLEQEFAERRTAPLKAGTPGVARAGIRPAEPVRAPEREVEADLPEAEAEEVFDLDAGESFSIVDFEDDDDF
ncbi:MAG: hypothetical protein ACO1RX_16930 [Candidatus Sericytochromatia bacterium]